MHEIGGRNEVSYHSFLLRNYLSGGAGKADQFRFISPNYTIPAIIGERVRLEVIAGAAGQDSMEVKERPILVRSSFLCLGGSSLQLDGGPNASI